MILIADNVSDSSFARIVNHERIHRRQIIECLIVPFYILYFFFYIKGLIKYGGQHDEAYYSIPFEVEAYKFDDDFRYLKNRKYYQWLKNLK